MSTNYRNLTLRGNTLLSIPESEFSQQDITIMMNERVSDLVFDRLVKDPCPDEPLSVTVARSYLLDAVAAVTLGKMAGAPGQKIEAIRLVRHLYDCGLSAARELTELFMGLDIKLKCAPEPAPLPTIMFVIEI